MLQHYHDSGAPHNPGFELLPAIDLRGGRVVRLLRGDFDAETVYGGDPVAVACSFVADGARWLHVVDLDGARSGAAQQRDVIGSIVERVGEGVRCQVAGGLRDEASVAAALSAGAARVVLGTAVVANPTLGAALVRAHGSQRIVAALDVRAGHAVGRGWVAGAPGRRVEATLEALAAAGIETFAVTAIERDGTLSGPDLALITRLVGLDRGRVIASGGIESLDDLRRIRGLGCAGAIVGRALYEARFSLAEALAAVR